MTDIDPGLISSWQASPRKAEQVAARLAAELHSTPRWDPVDGNPAVALRMDVSASTVRRAKTLLASHGVIMKDSSGGTGYYAAGPGDIAAGTRSAATPAGSPAADTPGAGRPVTTFTDVWVDLIRQAHAEIPEAEAIRFTRADGTTVTVTYVTLDFLAPQEELRRLEVRGTTADGQRSTDVFPDAPHDCPPELAPLIAALTQAQRGQPWNL